MDTTSTATAPAREATYAHPLDSLTRSGVQRALSSAGPVMSGLTRKLNSVLPLSAAEHLTLDAVQGVSTLVKAGAHIVREGDRPTGFCVLLDGWAFRYKRLPGGQRQIFALLLPGDLCEIRSMISSHADHGVCTLTPATLVRTPADKMLAAVRDHPRIAEALWRAALLDEAIMRAWLFNLGLRKAPARMAHLFCELACRLRAIDPTSDDGAFRLPLTQQELGESLGLTSVHVNRVLQYLRAESLIDFRNGVLKVLDMARLRTLGEFDERYLKT